MPTPGPLQDTYTTHEECRSVAGPSTGRANIINSLLPLPLLRTAAAAAPVILSDYTDTDGPSLTLELGIGRGIRLRAAGGGCCRILPLQIHVLGGRILQCDGKKHLLWIDLPHAGMAAVGQGEQKTALQVFFSYLQKPFSLRPDPIR